MHAATTLASVVGHTLLFIARRSSIAVAPIVDASTAPPSPASFSLLALKSHVRSTAMVQRSRSRPTPAPTSLSFPSPSLLGLHWSGSSLTQPRHHLCNPGSPVRSRERIVEPVIPTDAGDVTIRAHPIFTRDCCTLQLQLDHRPGCSALQPHSCQLWLWLRLRLHGHRSFWLPLALCHYSGFSLQFGGSGKLGIRL
ncbi:hypothetical protein GW17_00020820 [Ensete ventricosum]|nr:hypothetical protein GW17_00020820 [Ensete ventricosum]